MKRYKSLFVEAKEKHDKQDKIVYMTFVNGEIAFNVTQKLYEKYHVYHIKYKELYKIKSISNLSMLVCITSQTEVPYPKREYFFSRDELYCYQESDSDFLLS